jgi:cardiolipin synthase A/B
MNSTAFLVIAIIAIVVQSFMLFPALFEPGLDYKISTPPSEPIESDQFMCILEAITDAKVNYRSRIEVLTNGEVYYEAELEAIRAARSSINLEAYIFQKGEVTREFIAALTERARLSIYALLCLLSGLGAATVLGGAALTGGR